MQTRSLSFPLRLLLALLSGVLLAFAFPPVMCWPLALIALAPLIVSVRHARSNGEAFLLGELSLATHWLLAVPWVVNVMAHFGGLGLPVGITIFIAMSLFLGIWGGFFALLIRLTRSSNAAYGVVLIPLLWVTTEYGRTWLFSGFPWDLLGEAFIGAQPLAMTASLAGPYFLSALGALCAAAAAWQFSAAPRRSKMQAAIGAISLIALTAVAGEVVLNQRMAETNEWHVAAMLQPNISQEMRWNGGEVMDIFQRMMSMTEQAAQQGVEVVIWPESTVPLTFATTDFYRDFVQSISRDRHVDVILGSVAEDPGDPSRIWNTAYLVSGGETRGRYDKIRLVPFGEYVPLRKLLFFAEKLVHAVGSFQFGTNDHPLEGRFRYGPAICYEVVFPQITATQVRHGANVLVTVTNDAWFGRSAAPVQHLQMARMRAIEDDRWILRSATTGISAVIDPQGKVLQRLELGEQGIVRARFSTRQSLTPYVRFGDWFAWLAVATTVLFLFIKRKAPRYE